MSRSRLLVVGTYRDPAGTGGERLDRSLPELLRWPSTVSLPLRPLTEDDVRAYLGDSSAGVDAVRTAHRRSGGNPLYLRAVVRVLRSTPDGAVDGGSELRHLVRTTLATLPPATLDLLDTAAVLGEEVDAARLAAVTDRPLPEVHAGLDAAVRAGVLTALPDAPGRRRFVHAVVRDAIYGALSPSTREELHRRAAEALERVVAEDDAAAGLVAGHWLRAARAGALGRAASWARRAADTATRTLAFDEAARFLADRPGLGPDGPAPPTTSWPASSWIWRRRSSAPAGSRRPWSTRSRPPTWPRACGRGDLLAAAALAVHDVGAPELQPALLRMCERALESVDAGSDPALRSRLLSQTASALADAGRLGAAAPRAVEALDLAERCGDPGAVVDAAGARMKASPTAVEPAEQLRLGLLAIEHSAATGQPLAALWGARWRIDAGLETRRHGHRGRRTGAGGRARPPHRPAPGALARPEAARLGRRAARPVRRGVRTQRRGPQIGSSELADDLSTTGLSAAFWVQHLSSPGRHPTGAPRQPRRSTAPATCRSSRSPGAWSPCSRDGGTRRAARYDVLRRRMADPDFATSSGVDINLVPLVEEFGDAAAAELLREQISRRVYIATGAGVYAQGSIAVLLGRLAVVRGRPDEAIDWFERSLAEDTGTGARPAAVNDRIALGRALLDRGGPGDTVRAGELARLAAGEARRLGMRVREREAAALADRALHAGRTADPLTPREREIAGLVADALTNRQIAERLFLSERTVESHVRNILAKLGLTNRTEIATTGGGD